MKFDRGLKRCWSLVCISLMGASHLIADPPLPRRSLGQMPENQPYRDNIAPTENTNHPKSTLETIGDDLKKPKNLWKLGVGTTGLSVGMWDILRRRTARATLEFEKHYASIFDDYALDTALAERRAAELAVASVPEQAIAETLQKQTPFRARIESARARGGTPATAAEELTTITDSENNFELTLRGKKGSPQYEGDLAAYQDQVRQARQRQPALTSSSPVAPETIIDRSKATDTIVVRAKPGSAEYVADLTAHRSAVKHLQLDPGYDQALRSSTEHISSSFGQAITDVERAYSRWRFKLEEIRTLGGSKLKLPEFGIKPLPSWSEIVASAPANTNAELWAVERASEIQNKVSKQIKAQGARAEKLLGKYWLWRKLKATPGWLGLAVAILGPQIIESIADAQQESEKEAVQTMIVVMADTRSQQQEEKALEKSQRLLRVAAEAWKAVLDENVYPCPVSPQAEAIDEVNRTQLEFISIQTMKVEQMLSQQGQNFLDEHGKLNAVFYENFFFQILSISEQTRAVKEEQRKLWSKQMTELLVAPKIENTQKTQ
ncbi:MAG: hypothetical protein HY537_07465 [Deltaproteobacteria bacterium]|nr:hypothetical protein [Deltaproteobacteria bacterium]